MVAITDGAGALAKLLQSVVHSPVVTRDNIEISLILHTLILTAIKSNFFNSCNPCKLSCKLKLHEQ